MITHLNVRTSYTLLESTIQVEELVKKTKELGYDSIAITDRNVLYAYPSFLKYCKQYQIKPIFGLEIVVNYHNSNIPFLLLAKDNLGYKNLIQLSSKACSNADSILAFEDLLKYSNHNFLISYGEGGYIDSELISDNKEGVIQKLTQMKNEFPEFDVAISYQEASLWKLKNKMLKEVCRMLSIHTVALNKVYYLKPNDDETYHILSAIRTQKSLNDASLTKVKGRYLLSQQEMNNLYDAEDLDRTSFIASNCNCDLKLDKTDLPSFKIPDGIRADQYLTQLSLAGLKKRLNGESNQTYLNRLKYELNVIIKMHFENYFLIVYDFIRYAKKNDILIGPGRGSVCGSLCAYSLGITEVDPLKYDLLFERFLNPERISMPDIDTDIPDNKRQDVINYVSNKYGEKHVASIVTFGTFGPKQAIRDIARIMNLRESDVSLITKQLSSNKVSLKEQYQKNSKLRDILNADIHLKKVYEYAMRIEGLPKHTSIHAAGVILSKLELNDVIPTTKDDTGLLVSQYTMEYLEERGLIKMDFLGLRNLSMIHDMVSKIKESNQNFSLPYVPLPDSKVFACLSRGDTLGIFQVESEGMKNLLKKMKVSSFDDIVASIALYRPASFNQIPIYIENKEHPDKISYLNSDLKNILSSTYGVLIYQEQAMKISEVAAGFSLSKADILRKAISKKNSNVLLSLKNDFISGCIKNRYSENDANALYDLIEKFADYGFNKSHAVAYSIIVYQMTYIKVHYPLVFYSSLLDTYIGDSSKMSLIISEARKHNIQVLGPDVNESMNTCIIQNNSIRLPLDSVRMLRGFSTDSIIDERKKNKYIDFYDFVARVSLKNVTRSDIELLIKAGALDSFKENRNTLLNSLDDAFNYADLVRINKNGKTILNYNLVSKQPLKKYADSIEERMKQEKEVLGFYLGKHPIITMREKIYPQYSNISSILSKKDTVQGIGLINNIREHRTKKGDMMAFVTINDESGDMTLLVMPRTYAKLNSILKKNIYIIFNGKMTEDASCIVNDIKVVEREYAYDKDINRR